jgi:hypothetical protein
MKSTLKMLALSALVAFSAVKGYSSTNESYYNSGEWGVGLGTAYSLEGGFSAENYDFNLAVQASWFPFKNLGLTAELPFYTASGVVLREVGLSLVGRAPLYKGLGFQTSVGSYYDWNSKDFNYAIEPALTFRFNPKWQVSLGGQYLINDFRNFKYSNGNWNLRTFVTLYF